jgi:dTDP-4-amino-4,6-dideoxygalactose transaminase
MRAEIESRWKMPIPYNKPHFTGAEKKYIEEAFARGTFQGGGDFSKRAAALLEKIFGTPKAILTPSGTAALEMMMLLADIGPGDEVIVPSFTFTSTANAVVLRGGRPVFADIRPDTLNIDEKKLEASVTARTKAIVPMHYAGVGCEMDVINAVAAKHGLLVLEDAAQGIGASYKNVPLGSLGQMAAVSFHATKNIHCGEGGALLINDARFAGRAETVMEKGSDRARFLRGEADRYTWVDVGSSFLMNETTAAFLLAQLESLEEVTRKRLEIWDRYHRALEPLEKRALLRRPIVPGECRHNAHIFYVLLPDADVRGWLAAGLKEKDISAVSHYEPLHSSLFGRRFANDGCGVTADLAPRLLRLPLYYEMSPSDAARVAERIEDILAE